MAIIVPLLMAVMMGVIASGFIASILAVMVGGAVAGSVSRTVEITDIGVQNPVDRGRASSAAIISVFCCLTAFSPSVLLGWGTYYFTSPSPKACDAFFDYAMCYYYEDTIKISEITYFMAPFAILFGSFFLSCKASIGTRYGIKGFMVCLLWMALYSFIPQYLTEGDPDWMLQDVGPIFSAVMVWSCLLSPLLLSLIFLIPKPFAPLAARVVVFPTTFSAIILVLFYMVQP